jgi:hypothetical protein
MDMVILLQVIKSRHSINQDVYVLPMFDIMVVWVWTVVSY